MVVVQRAHPAASGCCTGRHSRGRTTAGLKAREKEAEPSPVTPVIMIGTEVIPR